MQAEERVTLAARAQEVQHGAKHLVQIHHPGLGLATGCLQQGQDVGKLGAADVARVGLRAHPSMLSEYATGS